MFVPVLFIDKKTNIKVGCFLANCRRGYGYKELNIKATNITGLKIVSLSIASSQEIEIKDKNLYFNFLNEFEKLFM